MSGPKSIRELIDQWPTRKELADDCSVHGEVVTADRVHKWAATGAIPAKYHLLIVRASERRGFGITAHDLAVLHSAVPPAREDAA